jgi:flagellar basal-body rod modification protein FlgD
MARIQANDTASLIQAANNSNNAGNTRGGGLADLELDQFLNLMITELQNQDPLSPTDNADLMNQIGQMREISANDALTKTLQTVLNGQNLTTASTLIGHSVKALDDKGENIEGVVDRVTLETNDNDVRSVRVHINDSSVELSNIREIINEGS